MPAEDRFYQAVIEALAHDRLTLPTLPDVALRIRDCCDAPDASAAKLAGELSRDAAMAARILRVANSAGQGARSRVESPQAAVTRLGLQLTRLLVTGFAVEQSFACKSPELRLRLRSHWSQSIEIAALARVLAKHFTVLKPDLAMLAGLMHDIGALAILRAADQSPQPPGPAALEDVIEKLGGRAGELVLRAWEFPPEIVPVPVQALDFRRWHEGPADYADVVTVALLQCDAAGPRHWWSLDRASVPAFVKLDINPSVESLDLECANSCAETVQLLAA